MPEIILPIVLICIIIAQLLFNKKVNLAVAGCVAMAVMLIVTGISHFFFTKGMRLMLPDVIPFRTFLVYATGVLEIALAIGLLIPKYRRYSAKITILFFLLILPANIYATMHHVNIKTGEFDGEDISYLWYRIPLQAFFILWLYLSAIGKRKII